MKLDARIKEEEKAKLRKKTSSTLLPEDTAKGETNLNDDDTTYFSENQKSSSSHGQEVHKVESVLRSNSSFVEMSQGNMHRRMKDDTLDHSKVLSDSKHPITRICLTGGPCAGKTTALATLSTVLN